MTNQNINQNITKPSDELNPSPEGLGFGESPCSAFILEQAKKNLAKWGRQDLETLGLAIAEETGELCQAILQGRDEKGDRKRIREEATDLAALCLQLFQYLDLPPCAACDRGDYQLGHSDFCPQNKSRQPRGK